MSSILPDAPRFETSVYGTIFAERATAVARLRAGDALILVPDPAIIGEPAAPGPPAPNVLVIEEAKVWVHAPGGDVVGHLSPDVNRWLVPRMLAGDRYGAVTLSVGDPSRESWRRLVIEVRRQG